jgi:ribosomal protein S18 acetylase RimI-like enzyme
LSVKPKIRVRAHNDASVVLRSAEWKDQEALRALKNANRQYFFHKELIDSDGQSRWFEGHLGRHDDHMFIVVAGEEAAGCLGVRVLGDTLDIYNVIGDERFNGKGYMSRGLRMMTKFALERYPRRPLRLKVLKNNPAIQWYERNGFQRVGVADDHLDLEFDSSVTLPEISIVEEG